MILVASLLAAFAAAWAARLVQQALQRAVRGYRERYGIGTARDFLRALPLLDAAGVRALGAAGAIALAAPGALVGGVAAGLLLALAGGAAPFFLVGWLRTRRVRLFDRQLVVALESAASGLQAGLSLLQSLEGACAESESPLRDELGLALREIRMGASVEEALDELCARVASEELGLFVAGTAMARQVGGNLAASYRTIAEALRERFRVEGKLQALTAQGRLQGWVVGALPLLLALVIHRIRPDLVEPLLTHPVGWARAAVAIALEVVGFFWIRRLLRPAW